MEKANLNYDEKYERRSLCRTVSLEDKCNAATERLKDFCEHLKSKHGESYEKIATRLEVMTAQQLRKILKGDQRLSLPLVFAFEDAFGVTFYELLTGEPTPKLQEVAARIDRMMNQLASMMEELNELKEGLSRLK